MITLKIELGGKPKKDGTFAVYLRITHNRKLKRVSLGFSILKQHHNANGNADKQNWIRTTHPTYRQLNTKILDAVSQAHQAETQLKGNATGKAIAKAMRKEETPDSFVRYMDEFLARLADGEYNTEKGYRASIGKFKRYLADCEVADLPFDGLTGELVGEYRGWMKKKLKNGVNTVAKDLSRLRAIINDAVRNNRMPYQQNPFLVIRLSYQKGDMVRLTQAELNRLVGLQLTAGSLIWHVRNTDLFSFYCAGIRCGDLLSLQWKNLLEGRLLYSMGKTDSDMNIKLPAQANEILAHYRKPKQNPGHFIFPFLDNSLDYSQKWLLKQRISAKNALLNQYLAKLSELADIRKITFHTARHTFGDLGRKKTKDVYAISKALGHSSIKITQAYLSSFDTDSVDEAMENIYS